MKLHRAFAAVAIAIALLVSPLLAAEQSSIVTPTSGPMNMATFAGGYLNPALRAIQSCNWGTTAPANGPGSAPLSYECWADTSSNPVTFKRWDGAQWVVFGKLDTSAHTWTHVDSINAATEVWYATGQSNFAVQRAFGWAPPANAHVWNNSIGNCINTGTAWTALDPTTITPEDAFIADRAAHYPTRQIYLVRVAYQGEAIAQWLPGAVDNCPTPATLQDMYAKGKNNIVAALANLGLSQLTGILLWQGETDGINGSTTWIANAESLVTRFKAETFYPSLSSAVPNWIVFGIAGRMQSTTFATADAFNQTYILPFVNNDPFYRMFVNTAAFPAAYWDTTVIPGHMNAQGYYEAGSVASRALYTNVPDGYVFMSGNTTGGALNGSPSGMSSPNAFSTLNNNIAKPIDPIAGTMGHWIQRDGQNALHTIDAFGNGGLGPIWLGRYAEGTMLAPVATAAGHILSIFGGQSYDGTGPVTGWNTPAKVTFKTCNLQSATDHSGQVIFTYTSSMTQTDGMALACDGSVRIPASAAATGAGTLNVANGVYNNGVAPVGSGGGYLLSGGTTTNDDAAAGARGEYLQSGTSSSSSSVTVTISNASPAVVTDTAHGMTAKLNNCGAVSFTTTGSLPSPIADRTVGPPFAAYYATIVDANSYKLSSSAANCIAGTFINTTTAGSGTHTAYKSAFLQDSTVTPIAAIPLTAGDWEVTGKVAYGPAASTVAFWAAASMSTNAAALDQSLDRLVALNYGTSGIPTGGIGLGGALPLARFSLSSPTTVYLLSDFHFGTSTAVAQGIIRARRPR